MNRLQLNAIFTIFFVSIFALSCTIYGQKYELTEFKKTEKCLLVRAAFDIGSESTKMKVAQIDRCKRKVLQELGYESIKISFRASIDKNMRLSSEIMALGKSEILRLKSIAENLGATEFVGVATAAFRIASNGTAAIEKLSKNTGVRIKLISEQEEGELPFRGLANASNLSPNNMMVWDIGGGSLQLSVFDDDSVKVFSVPFASVAMKQWISQHQGKPKDSSPNPIDLANEGAARAFLASSFKDAVPEWILSKLQNGQPKVYGIGNVWTLSVLNQFSKHFQTNKEDIKVFSVDQLRQLTEARLGLNDAELGGGDYVASDVSNLIFCLGWSEILGVDAVYPTKFSLVDSVLLKEFK